MPDPDQTKRPNIPAGKLPGIPVPGNDLAAMRTSIVAMKEILEVMLGRLGTSGQSYVSHDVLNAYIQTHGLGPPLDPEPLNGRPHRAR